jgi:hypothetical protein
VKRDWYVYGIDKYGRRHNAAGGGFTQKGAVEWASAPAALRDAKTCGFGKLLATNGSERHEFTVPRN